MYIGVHDGSAAPDPASLDANMDLAAARSLLSGLANIDENSTASGEGGGREFAANIRHSLFFTFQGQGEVADPGSLFHSQKEEYVPQAIRDVIPYFLGAVDPSSIRKRAQLRNVRRELREVRRRISEDDEIVRPSGRASGLISECKTLGLLPADFEYLTNDEAILALTSVLEAPAEQAYPAEDQPEFIQDILNHRENLRRQMSEARAEADSLRALLAAQNEYGGEAAEQGARLQTLSLLRTVPDTSSTSCPVCQSQLDDDVPSVTAMREQLQRLENEISGVRQSTPNVQALLGERESQIQEISRQLRQNQNELNDALASQVRLSELRDLAVSRAASRGRVSLYLEGLGSVVEKGLVNERLLQLEELEAQLMSDLDEIQAQSRLESALARVALHMADVVRALQTEYAGVPVRLDINKLTVVVDTISGPATLAELGSGANWLAYHLAALFGLHRYFREQNRPVPRFLVLDQPSQVYYPQDPSSGSQSSDEDREAVRRIFRAIYDFAQHDSQFQVIVIDHADLDEDWFQDSVIERWRDGQALVPNSWLDAE